MRRHVTLEMLGEKGNHDEVMKEVSQNSLNVCDKTQ